MSNTKIAALNTQACLSISGNDAKSFLQSILTCDMENTPSLGALCNRKGRVLVIVNVLCDDDKYYLIFPKELLENTIKTLTKYIFRQDVSIEDITNDVAILGLWEKNDDLISLSLSDELSIAIAKKDHSISATCEKEEWEFARMQLLIPEITLETRKAFLPHHINLDKLKAVSFKKGCYTGQEIITRMEHLGKIKQHLVLYASDDLTLLKPNSEVKSDDGSLAGYVVNSLIQDDKQWILGTLSREM